MGIVYENHCVDCGLPCIGEACRYKKVPVRYCDKCGAEVDTLYWYKGEQWCYDCIIEDFTDELEEVNEE